MSNKGKSNLITVVIGTTIIAIGGIAAIILNNRFQTERSNVHQV